MTTMMNADDRDMRRFEAEAAVTFWMRERAECKRALGASDPMTKLMDRRVRAARRVARGGL